MVKRTAKATNYYMQSQFARLPYGKHYLFWSASTNSLINNNVVFYFAMILHSHEASSALQKEAALLYGTCTGQDACPESVCYRYGKWVYEQQNARPLLIPGLIRKWPYFLTWCEPLPGVNSEFDARRAAIITLAEHHPQSTRLFYRYETKPWPIVLMALCFHGIWECCKLPVRVILAWYLWR